MIDGVASAPFSAKGLPPLRDDEKTNNVEKVIAYSREQYASERTMVEERIMRWHEGTDEPTEEMSSQAMTQPPVSYQPAPSPMPYQPAPAPIQYQAAAPYQPTQAPTPYRPAPSQSVEEKPAYQPQNQPQYQPQAQNQYKKPGFEAKCSSCGQITSTPFQPDGIRPVYCKDCLSKKKEEKRVELEKKQQIKSEERERTPKPIQNQPASPIAKKDEPWITLDDLRNISPVDFKGRSVRPAPPAKPREQNEQGEPEGILNEGEEITVSQNNF